jgi:GntR family transcriptional regulator
LLRRLKRPSIPLYIEIADLLRQRIVRRTWTPGQRVPTVEELAAEFGVARVTVRQAMGILAGEGLIERHRGRGTFVAGAPEDTRWLRVETSLSSLSAMYEGTKPTLLMILDTVAAPAMSAADGTAARRYRYMKRLHSHGAVPYALIGIYLASDVFALAPRRFRNETVIPLLRSLAGVTIARARQTLTIATADMETAELLRVPVNSPIAEVRRVFQDENERVIYIGEVAYRGDFIHLEMDLSP